MSALYYFKKTKIRSKTILPLIFILIFVSLFLIYTFNKLKLSESKMISKEIQMEIKAYRKTNLMSEMKYILLWTNPNNTPFQYFGEGQSVFINKKCPWVNCYVTSDRNFLGDYTEFEVIVFNGPELSYILNRGDIPMKRFIHQKYVYANIESAAFYPICDNIWNEFFNWTWTYKLDSDSRWGYVAIRNAIGRVIGPNKNMVWKKKQDMDEIDDKLKTKLMSKTKAAAWFVSNCNTLSLREEYVTKIQDNLKKYNLEIDIYGSCGKFQCPKETMNRCLEMLEKDYYFYLAFENSFSEDYVTEKIVYPLQHNTVPIVLGGANYSRFLPDGIYLNALELGPKKLAKNMYDIIQNSTLYHGFFKWKKYYSYHFRRESVETDDYCHFCAVINNEKLMKFTTVYENFNSWWTDSITCFEDVGFITNHDVVFS